MQGSGHITVHRKPGTPVGIRLVDVEYGITTSSTVAPTSWSTTAPAWRDGYYMWSRTKVVYTDGRTEYKAAACITGSKGGTGKGITAITEQYYLSSSWTDLQDGVWISTFPGWQDGMYVWTRSLINYSDGEQGYTQAYCATVTVPLGTNLLRGTALQNGRFWYRFRGTVIPGVDGQEAIFLNWANGKPVSGHTLYTWTAYADSITGEGFSRNRTGKTYIGHAYNRTSAAATSNPADYSWEPLASWPIANVIDVLEQSLFVDGEYILTAGGWYTLSFWARGTLYVRAKFRSNIIDTSAAAIVDGNTQAWPYSEADLQKTIPLTEDWQKHYITFKVKADSGAQKFVSLGVYEDNELAICMPKLEHGKTPTAWMLNSADQQGERGLTYRRSVWQAGKVFRNDTDLVSDDVRYLDVVTDVPIALVGQTPVHAYLCKQTHTSSAANQPGNTDYWTEIPFTDPVMTPLLLANVISAEYIDVESLAASEAFIEKLVVKYLRTKNNNVVIQDDGSIYAKKGTFGSAVRTEFIDLYEGTNGVGAATSYVRTLSEYCNLLHIAHTCPSNTQLRLSNDTTWCGAIIRIVAERRTRNDAGMQIVPDGSARLMRVQLNSGTGEYNYNSISSLDINSGYVELLAVPYGTGVAWYIIREVGAY